MLEPNEMEWGALLPAALGLVSRHEAITPLVMGLLLLLSPARARGRGVSGHKMVTSLALQF